MKAIALADFGSTFTKVTVVEAGSGRLLGQAQAPTTVTSDVLDGYLTALDKVERLLPRGTDIVQESAASSAAGGLRIAAVGLVEDLTASAARQAALNAGARIECVLAGQLDADDVTTLHKVNPEVILFAGGTDGGQEHLVLENATRIAALRLRAFVVVACNSAIASQVSAVFRDAGIEAEAVGNVMPSIGTVNVEPARRAIGRAFLSHVIAGKGLSTQRRFSSIVIMPTPDAVLRATALLAHTAGATSGGVVVVDIGGATTDVHSAIPEANPAGLEQALVPVLPVVRTVEGDIGMRYGAIGTVEVDGEWLRSQTRAVNFEECVRYLRLDPGFVPEGAAARNVDRLLATSCASVALSRHCGNLVTTVSVAAVSRIWADGPDLRGVSLVVGTGGPLVRSSTGLHSLADAIGRQRERTLSPRDCRFALDRAYVMSAVGVLAEIDPEAAVALLRAQILAQVSSARA